MRKLVMAMAAVMSMAAVAAPPPGGRPGPGPRRDGAEGPGERGEEREGRARMMFVVMVAEELELSEAEALKLSEKVKGIEARRRPLREQMHAAMRDVKAAADGDQAAFAQVEANIQKVLDGRAQMAALDKDTFSELSKDLTPQKKARLALVLARLHEQRGGGMRKHER
jgi:hypothetical protein